MSCINFKKRTKKGTIYFYCTKLKKIINYDECRFCSSKEYKEYKKINSHHKKHKLTKATSIPNNVKKIVYERDKHRCIFCNKLVPLECANSHVIKRSQLGLGIAKNIVCVCSSCHQKYDFGINGLEMQNKAIKYLKKHYNDWCIDDVKYSKFKKIEEN